MGSHVTERRRQFPPFRFDWRRSQIAMLDPHDDEWQEFRPVTIYRARVSPETLINVMQVGKQRWRWAIIHVSPIAVHVDGGDVGTLRTGKLMAEHVARPFISQEPIWRTVPDGSKDSGDSGESGELPF